MCESGIQPGRWESGVQPGEVRIRCTAREVQIRYTNKKVWIRYTNMLPVKSLHLCPNFCYPMDHNLQVSLYMRVLQARILEWVAMPSSRGSSWPRDWTYASCLSHWHTGSLPLAPPGKPIQSIGIRNHNKRNKTGVQYDFMEHLEERKMYI